MKGNTHTVHKVNLTGIDDYCRTNRAYFEIETWYNVSWGLDSVVCKETRKGKKFMAQTEENNERAEINVSMGMKNWAFKCINILFCAPFLFLCY